MEEKNKIEKSTLYLVGTPIGNLADISSRAIKTLSEVDFIAAEDTRNSSKLLSAYGIKKELVSYHEHNKANAGRQILSRLLSGESCALITDAGMPAISDPGEDICRLCAENGIKVTTVPGACAIISALALSALSTRRFAFEGFLSAKANERRRALHALRSEERTVIFYEAPHRLKSTLADMSEVFGNDRRISICRELTKLNEDVCRTTLGEAMNIYKEKEPRGEYVLVLEGCHDKTDDNPLVSLSPTEHVSFYVNDGMGKMDAIKKAAKERGMSKSELYKIVVEEE